MTWTPRSKLTTVAQVVGAAILLSLAIWALYCWIYATIPKDEQSPHNDQPMLHDQHKAMNLDVNAIILDPAARALAQIQVTPVERRQAEKKVRLYGTVDYNEALVQHIHVWVPGRVERLHVNFTGAEVFAGDPIAEFYSPQLITAQQELIQFSEAVAKLEGQSNSILLQQTVNNLEATRTKLRLWGITETQIDSIEQSKKVQSIMTIHAPVGGIVINKHINEGHYVKEDTTIYTIADLSKLWIRFQAYENDLIWLREGQPITYTTKARPGKTLRGIIDFIDPFMNTQTRTTTVRVNADNSSGNLQPGMYVTGIVSAEAHSVDGAIPLVIPESAPLITGTRAVVYVQDPDVPGVYSLREIVLGPKAGDFYVVYDGLREGELIVTHGNFKIDSSAQISGKPSMMSPEGGKKPMTGHQH